MKFYGRVRGGKRNMWLDLGSDPDDHPDCPTGNPAITQQIMSGFWWNFQEQGIKFGVGGGRGGGGVILIIMLTPN